MFLISCYISFLLLSNLSNPPLPRLPPTTLRYCFSNSSTTSLEDILVQWNFSIHNSIIINVDGSYLGDPIIVRFGALLRYPSGS